MPTDTTFSQAFNIFPLKLRPLFADLQHRLLNIVVQRGTVPSGKLTSFLHYSASVLWGLEAGDLDLGTGPHGASCWMGLKAARRTLFSSQKRIEFHASTALSALSQEGRPNVAWNLPGLQRDHAVEPCPLSLADGGEWIPIIVLTYPIPIISKVSTNPL